MSEDVRPKGFHENDIIEEATERTINKCLRYDRCRVNFETIDKYPNRDGFIELLDQDLIPVGELVIQVKKISEYDDTAKKQIDSKTLAYGYTTNPPFMILGVDTTNDLVFWKHASGEWLDEMELGKADSRVVEFSDDNVISGEDFSEMMELKRIAKSETEYLSYVEQTQKLKRIVEFIYNYYEGRPFQGAVLRKDFAGSNLESESEINITPGLIDKLAKESDYVKKLPSGNDAVAIVDKNAGIDERAVASINDTLGVQRLATRAVTRDGSRQLNEVINWHSPGHVIDAVNNIAGPVLTVAVNSRYYRITEEGIDLIQSS